MELVDEAMAMHAFGIANMFHENNMHEDTDTLSIKKITEETISHDLFKKINSFYISSKDIISDTVEDAVMNECNKINDTVTERQKTYEMELKKYEILAAQLEFCKRNVTEIVSILMETIKNEEEVNREITELQQSIESCEEPLSDLMRKLKCSENYTKIVPQLKKEFDMIRATFPIRFDHTAPDNKVRGYILKSKNGMKDLTPFDLDADSNSRQFISNFLWHQLESSEPFFT